MYEDLPGLKLNAHGKPIRFVMNYTPEVRAYLRSMSVEERWKLSEDMREARLEQLNRKPQDKVRRIWERFRIHKDYVNAKVLTVLARTRHPELE